MVSKVLEIISLRTYLSLSLLKKICAGSSKDSYCKFVRKTVVTILFYHSHSNSFKSFVDEFFRVPEITSSKNYSRYSSSY